MALEIDLRGKRALVTGASSGVGAGVAQVLARAGCRVAGTGRVGADDPRAAEFLEALRAEGGEGVYLSGDLADPAVPARLVGDAVAALGGLDLVVSNAGGNCFFGASEATEDEWQDCMDLNLASHWRLAKAARPHLEEADPGVFIAMGSNHAYQTIPGCFPYNVAKTALDGLVRALAIEWGPSVRVVGVAPGFIDTPGNQAWFDSFPDPAAERERTAARHPVGRIGMPEEVGNLCAFLASPLSGFITGNTLLMDGGRSALMQDS
ncbi:SDR family NAD(P)-dependent oxidoreductase [Haloferula sp. A504]|uniref:SDR family NAD(P)-dependent oxidoreductase n=1 Tax=Haloferula sp. A504 TaxID=3373601 RepID=UPI0031C59654|nr:SDR family oxidoreductase [Verrucomicrobiaceae bacterium E54]